MTELYAEIKTMLPLIERKNGWRAPESVVSGKRQYRGKFRYVAGYGHSRIGAHYASGLVHDRILGWGETQEQAIEMMRKKLLEAA